MGALADVTTTCNRAISVSGKRKNEMTKELKHDLEALAKKHGMELYLSCLYCQHGREPFGDDSREQYFITLAETVHSRKDNKKQ